MKKGAWEKCKVGEVAVEYNNLSAGVRRRTCWKKKSARQFVKNMRKTNQLRRKIGDKPLYTKIRIVKG